jgi:hypothetical protein
MTTKINSTPIPEGVLHGPYPPDEAEPNEAFNQARKLGNAITDAYARGRIDSSVMTELGKGVSDFAMNGVTYGREDEISRHYGDDASQKDIDLYFTAQDIEGYFQHDIQNVEEDWAFEHDVAQSEDENLGVYEDDEDTEDPLAGDVDRWVHPDETRTDNQIVHDEGIANRLHMSGGDGADEYWNDYDEYFGTVNGGEERRAEIEAK